VYVFNRAGEGGVLGLVGGRAWAGHQHVEDRPGIQTERALETGHAELRQCERARGGPPRGPPPSADEGRSAWPLAVRRGTAALVHPAGKAYTHRALRPL